MRPGYKKQEKDHSTTLLSISNEIHYEVTDEESVLDL